MEKKKNYANGEENDAGSSFKNACIPRAVSSHPTSLTPHLKCLVITKMSRSNSVPVNLQHIGVNAQRPHRAFPDDAKADRGTVFANRQRAKDLCDIQVIKGQRFDDLSGSQELNLDEMFDIFRQLAPYTVSESSRKEEGPQVKQRSTIISRIVDFGTAVVQAVVGRSHARFNTESTDKTKDTCKPFTSKEHVQPGVILMPPSPSDHVRPEQNMTRKVAQVRPEFAKSISPSSKLPQLVNIQELMPISYSIGSFERSHRSSASPGHSTNSASTKLSRFKNLFWCTKPLKPRKKEPISDRILLGDFHFDIVDPTDFDRTRHWGASSHFREVGRGHAAWVVSGSYVGLGVEIPAVVKFYKDVEVLNHEYTFYAYLQGFNLTFLPRMYGYYKIGKGENEKKGLVLDYISSISIYDIIKEKKSLPAHEWVLLVFKVAQYLGAIHDVGVLYNDLKPKHLLVARLHEQADLPSELLVYVIDFSYASDLDGISISDYSETSPDFPHHIAPEVLRGNSTSIQSDIYSLGVLFHLVYSQALVDGAKYNFGELLGITRQMLVPNPNDRPPLTTVIRKLGKSLERSLCLTPCAANPMWMPRINDLRTFVMNNETISTTLSEFESPEETKGNMYP